MSTSYATLETTRGKIIAELFDRDCPNTVDNFVRLANTGLYDGMKFHRVVPDSLVQTGDPLSKELPASDARVGSGGPGYVIPSETIGNRRRHGIGALSMAREGTDSSESQFLIVLDEATGREFNGLHTVFGQTKEGLDVIRAVEPDDVVLSIRVWQ